MHSNLSTAAADVANKFATISTKPTTTFMPEASIVFNSVPSVGENVGWVVVGDDGSQVWYPFGIIDLSEIY